MTTRIWERRAQTQPSQQTSTDDPSSPSTLSDDKWWADLMSRSASKDCPKLPRRSAEFEAEVLKNSASE